jgi:hypothetical protein
MAEKTKRKNPYQMLLEDAKKYAREAKYRRAVLMWTYDKAKLGNGWSLNELYERTAAAKQLGYDVVLEATADGLCVKYVKTVPDAPWAFRA